MCSAISLSSGVSFTVSDTEASASDINANILLSPTLKTGWPHGQSSYVSGNDNADRKSTRLNSSHTVISYAVFCLKKKKKKKQKKKEQNEKKKIQDITVINH